jgi:hypothetical protein
MAPEHEAQDGEGADVDAASGDGREDATDEAGQDEDCGLPRPKVDDRVVRLALLLPLFAKRIKKCCLQIIWMI